MTASISSDFCAIKCVLRWIGASSSRADSGRSVTCPLVLCSATSPNKACRASCSANALLATRARPGMSFCAVSTPKKTSSRLSNASVGGHAGHTCG
eukprot:1680913-Prymnesium_polylepis.1